jgi:hypothetical protein
MEKIVWEGSFVFLGVDLGLDLFFDLDLDLDFFLGDIIFIYLL